MTNDADIRIAKSIVEYVFRWFGKKFLTTGPEGGGRNSLAGGQGAPGVAVRRGWQRRFRGAVRGEPARPDGPFQRVGGRGGVRQLRRPEGSHRVVLHVQGLRD